MARDRDRGGDGKAKVRIFFAEIEGGDDTIQEGLRTLGQTLVRTTQPQVAPRVVKPLQLDGSKPTDTAADQPTLFPPDPESAEPDLLEDTAEEITQQPPKESRPRKPSTYTIVTELNLRPADKPSLKDFFAQKKPEDNQEQIAVFVYYLSRILGETKIGPRHVYTCYKDVGGRVPVNISDVVAKTASRKGWIAATAAGGYTTTTMGENFVDHDLPKKKSD